MMLILGLFEEFEETPAQVLNRRQLRAWADDCTSGTRSPIDHLTDCERRVLVAVMEAGYELTGHKFRRQIVPREEG
jgi:hypothetical protein